MMDAALRQGAQALGLVLSEGQITQLLDFLALLQKWNKVYNLTAVRDPQEMLTHHLLDSLAAVAPLRRHLAGLPVGQGARLLDVGSGGGLPGVVFDPSARGSKAFIEFAQEMVQRVQRVQPSA